MLPTPFTEILRRILGRVPGAVGGALAAPDGEIVDAVSEMASYEWRVLTAHYGVVLANARAALNTLHYGEPLTLSIRHDSLNILIAVVERGYFVLIALKNPEALARGMAELESAVDQFRAEMW